MTARWRYPAVAVSRQRCSEPERDSGPVIRCARMAAALIAILAIRVVISNSGHATWLHTPWVLVGVALGAGVMLHSVGRGLMSQLPRPRWSARFAGTWAGSSALLLMVLLASGGSHSFGAWISVARCLSGNGAGRVDARSASAAGGIYAMARANTRAGPSVGGSDPVRLDADRIGPSAAAGWLV